MAGVAATRGALLFGEVLAVLFPGQRFFPGHDRLRRRVLEDRHAEAGSGRGLLPSLVQAQAESQHHHTQCQILF